MAGWIFLGLIVVFIIWQAIAISNRFKVLLVKIQEADSGIDVALLKRYDTLTKLIDVVKGYTKHETELLREVIRLRSGMGMAEREEAHLRMDEAEQKIRILAESYPELRSSENYRQLQEAIVDAEDHLQAARRVYNVNVSSFNQAIVQFPASIIANFARHAPRDFFETDALKREDVKISF